MTFNKLKGMALMFNAILPFASALVIVILLASLVYDVKRLLEGPVAQLSSRAAALGTEAAKTGEAIQGVLAPIRSVGNALDQVRQHIQNIPERLEIPAMQTPPLDLRLQPSVSVASRISPEVSRYTGLRGDMGFRPVSLSMTDVRSRPALWRPDSQTPPFVRAGLSLPKVNIPKPSIPNPIPSVRVEWHNRRVQIPAIPATTIPVPGLSQVKDLLTQNTAILSDLKQLVGTVPVLVTLRDHVTTVVDNLQPWLRALSHLGGKVVLLLVLIACLVVPIGVRIYVVTYVRHLFEQFRMGWALVSNASTDTRYA